MNGELWARLCRTLEGAAAIAMPPDTADDSSAGRDRADGYRYLAHFLSAGLAVCIEHADTEHPEFGRMTEHTRKWGLDMPDCLYLYASVRGDAEYRIFGNRGSAHHIDIQVNAGHFATGEIASWRTLASTNGFSLDCDPDGSFELLLSPATEVAANALWLQPDAEFVLIRQYFSDWDHERPADLYIERCGAPASAPPADAADTAARLERLCQWLSAGAERWRTMSQGLLSMEPNSLVVHRADDAGTHTGLSGQAYGMGNFYCEPDECVVIEFTPPECHHWSVSLANQYWESLDYLTHQSSLNRHQTRLDRDGLARVVIAHRDPGIANWLDTTGHVRGSLAIRFLLARETPKIRLSRMPFDSVKEALPPDTVRVSPAQRSEALVRRRRAIWRRDRR